MRRDVRRQITQLGDPQPHLPIADDHLAGSAGEHDIADHRLRLDHHAGEFDKGRERCAGLGIGQPCSSSWQIDLRPSQAQNFTASPSGQDHQPCGGNGRLPDLLLPSSIARAQLPILIISQPSLPSSIGEPDDTMRRIVEANDPCEWRR